MNTLTAPFPIIALPRQHRLLAGVVLSVLAHIALMWFYRTGAPRFVIEEAPARPLAVRIMPPEPVVQTAPPPSPVVVRDPAPKPKSPSRRVAPPRDAIAMPASAAEAPETVFATQSEETAPSEPQAKQPAFDMDKARLQARKLANAPDPAKADSPLARLQQRQLEEKTKAAKAMEGARRPWCKDGLPGGLLAPIFLLFEKKDSGCRW